METPTEKLPQPDNRAGCAVADGSGLHARRLPVRIGGLMRCCIATLNGAAFASEKEGDVLPCKYCKSSMRVKGGAWEWNHD